MVRFFSLLKLEKTACMRVAAIKLTKGAWPDEIVVDETTGLAYNDTTYKHRVSECRDLAAGRVGPLEGLGDVHGLPLSGWRRVERGGITMSNAAPNGRIFHG